MSLLVPNVKKIEAEIAALAERIAKTREMLSLLLDPNWGQMDKWLEGEIERLKEQVLREDLAVGQTTAIRAQVWALRLVKDLPKRKKEELEQAAERARALRDRLSELHTRGRNVTDTALQNAERVVDQTK